MPANKTLINRMWDNDGSVLHPVGLGLKINFEELAPKDKTHVFVMSPEVSLAAEKLVRSPGFSFPNMEDWHLPYEHVAIEYRITEDIVRECRKNPDGAEQISTIGAYIQETKHNGFLFTPYWEFTNGKAQCSIFSFCIGTPEEINTLFPIVSINPKKSAEGAMDVHVSPSVALIKAASEAGIYPTNLRDRIFNYPDANLHMRESAVEIPVLFFACNMLINCRSGVQKTYVPERKTKMSGLGKRMRNKLSASAYTVMHLSAIETVDPDGTVQPKTDIAAHYVRGHFKQRRSGVYWWSPFVRGTGELRKRDAYIVKE